MIEALGKLFFVRIKMENHFLSAEVTMLGSKVESRGFLSSLTILDKEDKVFMRTTCHPRPISLEEWGQMGLVVPGKALSSTWKTDGKTFVIKMNMTVEEV